MMNILTFRNFIMVIAVMLSANDPSLADIPMIPDTILLNGRIITADNDDPDSVSIVEAIALRDGKIVSVGSNADIRRMAVDETEVIDLKSRTVIPGLIDTHSHLYTTSLGFPWAADIDPQLLNIRLNAQSEDQAVELAEAAIRARAKGIEPGQWISVRMDPSNIAHSVFGDRITRRVLDSWAPSHPVMIRTRASLVINTKGIEAFESYFGEIPELYWTVDKETGWSGQYVDFPRAMAIDLVMGDHMDKYAEIFKSVLQVNAQNGVTTHATHAQSKNGYLVGLMLDRAGEMPIRWAWSLAWAHVFYSNPSIEAFYNRMPDTAGHGTDFLWSLGMNPISLDGGALAMCTSITVGKEIKDRERCTNNPDDVGYPRVLALQTALKNGLHVGGHHVAGDVALDYYQDAVENSGLSLEKIRSLRLQTDHCHQVRPDQIQWAARFGKTFSCDVGIEVNEVVQRDYGDEYLSRFAPFKSMLDAGIRPIISQFGSESHVKNSPFESGYMFLTRRSLDGKTPIGVPEEAIPDRMTMLLMMTRWASIPMLRENLIGSIEPGKFADLAVLNAHLMDVPIEELPSVKPVMTMVQGKIVFEDPQFRGNTLRFNVETANWEKDLKTDSQLWRW